MKKAQVALSMIAFGALCTSHAEQVRFCKRNDGTPPQAVAPGLRVLPSVDYASYCDKPGFKCTSVPANGPDADKYDCTILSTKGKLPQPASDPGPEQPDTPQPAPNMPKLVMLHQQKQTPGGSGKISICRTPGISELMDNKPVDIAATGTYAGSCDKNGNNCRSVIVAATQDATLAPGKKACVTVSATIQSSDNKPLKRGDILRAQWVVTGFTPTIRVIQDFK